MDIVRSRTDISWYVDQLSDIQKIYNRTIAELIRYSNENNMSVPHFFADTSHEYGMALEKFKKWVYEL